MELAEDMDGAEVAEEDEDTAAATVAAAAVPPNIPRHIKVIRMGIRLTSTIKVSRDEATTPKDTKPSKDAANSSMANSNKAVAEGVDRMHPNALRTRMELGRLFSHHFLEHANKTS